MTSILAFIFVLGVLVVLHEAGHFLIARLVGAPVEVFSVGFGKRLWGFERGGTDYRISLVPLGGYVRVIGLGPDETDVATGNDEVEPELLVRWKRGLILLGGPVANIIAAVFFVAIAFMIGVEVPVYQSEPPVVGWVEPESPASDSGIQPGDLVLSMDGQQLETWRDLETSTLQAGGREVLVAVQRDGEFMEIPVEPEKRTRYDFGYSGILPPLGSEVVQLIPGQPAERAGIEVGDRIVEIAGQPVEQFYDLIRLISPHPGEEIPVVLERDGELKEFRMTPNDIGGEGKIGIAVVFPSRLERFGLIPAVKAGWTECVKMTRQTFRVLRLLVTGKLSLRQVSGPLEIGRISGEAAKEGVHSLILFMGIISLQLGIFNLLPIPVLDGGHLTILAFESAARRDLSMRVKERILEVGFVLLILLMVVVMYNDIVKLLPKSVYDWFSRG